MAIIDGWFSTLTNVEAAVVGALVGLGLVVLTLLASAVLDR